MKNLNEFSTPIADDAYGEAQDFHASGYVVPLSTARDLERKLAACREALEYAQSCNEYDHVDVEIMQDKARATLAATEP